ncbi:MAG TPA: GAF domain-containing protein [Acidobacteriota bacterium]|nr:GAF domain-containing protein [Acidobacteriota bacterium]
MVTGVLSWIALVGGLIVIVLSLGARDRRWKLRLQTAAALAGIWSGALLVVHLLPRGDLTVAAVSATENTSVLVPFLLVTGFLLAVIAAFVVEFRWDPAREFAAGIHSPIGKLWMRLTRALTDAPLLDSMLMEAASAVRKSTGARLVHVYRVTAPGDMPKRIGSAGDTDPLMLLQTDDGMLDMPTEVASLCIRRGDATTCVRPDPAGSRLLGIPIGVNGTAYAVIVLDDPQVDTTHADVTSYLCGMGALVGRSVHDWTLAVRGATYGRLCQGLSDLLPTLLDETQLERGLPPVADVLSQVIPVDYVSIAWQHGAVRHENRASMVIGDHTIVENRRHWPIAETTRRAQQLKRTLITPDLHLAGPEEAGRDETWESRLGMRSRIVAPVQHAGVVIGTLTIAHELPACYGEEETRLVGIVCDILALWLGGLASRQAKDSWEAADALADRLRSDPWRWTDIQALLEETQGLLDVSGLRLYRLISETGELMETAAAGRVTNGNTPRKLPLADLPWHRFALDRSRPLYVDQDDPEITMDRGEATRALMPEFRTANIVPVTRNGSVLGFLDVMEARDPDRKSLQPCDRFLLRAVADHAAHLWSGAVPRPGSQQGDSAAGGLSARLKELHRDIVNPITSIIGSVELIRHKQPDLTGVTIKYLNTIERSAVRIQEATTGFYDGITPEGLRPARTAAVSPPSVAIGIGRRGTFTRPASMHVVGQDVLESDSPAVDRSPRVPVSIQG